MKYINFKRYKFSTVTKYISYATGSIKKILKTADIIFKKIDIKRINLRKLTRYLNFKNYDSVKISKHIDLKKYVYLSFLFIIFVCFLYVFIPTFFTYEKKIIQKVICNNEVLDCSINGKIKYRFYPNPRIVIQDLKINYLSENKNSLLIAEQAAVKLSLKNLISLYSRHSGVLSLLYNFFTIF